MARKAGFLSPRKAIYVFWEGESEEAYTKYLKKDFPEKRQLLSMVKKAPFTQPNPIFAGINASKVMLKNWMKSGFSLLLK